MNILITTGIFPPDVGGPATYSKLLAAELVKLGHKVRVITYSSSFPPLERGGTKGEVDFEVVKIVRSRFKPWNYFRFFQAVKKYGKEADLIYAQGPVSEGYPSYLASRILKKSLVVKITGDYSWEQAMNRGLTDKLIDEFQTMKEYPPSVKRMRMIQKTVCMHARIIITPSEYLKRIVVGWGIKPDKIKVIYNAVEKPELTRLVDGQGIEKGESRKKLGIAEDTFLILSSGRDVPWKGFAMLKEVVAELTTDHPEIEVKILHSAPRQEFHQYVSAADVYVLNTGYEGLSNTLVEVLHLGTPIITTNVCGNPEVIKNEVNGLLVDYNDAEQLRGAILRIYRDEELRGRLRGNSVSSLSAKFSLENMISCTDQLFGDIMSTK